MNTVFCIDEFIAWFKSTKMTQAAVGQAVGASRVTVGRWLKKTQSVPATRQAQLLKLMNGNPGGEAENQAVITVPMRFSPESMAAIEAAAGAHKMSVDEWLHEAALIVSEVAVRLRGKD